MKKILSLLMAASMAVSCGVQAFAAEKFTDISDDKYAWAKEYIVDMAEQGYINGYEDNTYRPDNKVTRLETILLFARAMGATNSANADFLALATDKYLDTVKKTGISFGYDEVCFMMARGILTEDDLKIFLSDGKASKPMPRQEAAAIITKAMCADEVAKAEVLVDLEYTDAKSIASDYSQYVFYVSEKGIMNGMDDGSFGPENSVLRSQIAVMLARTVDKMNLYIETILVSGLDVDKNNITIIDAENAEIEVGYTDYTRFFDGVEKINEEDFVTFSDAMLTYINNELVFVDMYEEQLDEAGKGVYQGSVTEDGVITVTIKPEGETESKEYVLSANAELKNVNGAATTLKNISVNSYVDFSVAKGVIVKFNQLEKNSYILNAVVDSISIEDDLYLVISHQDKEYDGMKFVLNDNIAVYKNNDIENLSKLYKGDRVDITLEYGEIVKIVAISDTKTYDATISELTISSTPILKANINGNVVEYEVVNNVTVIVDGKEGSLYDLRVGDKIKITTESGAVLKITKTASATTAEAIMGQIEVVNSSKGFIMINSTPIFCSDSSTKIITAAGVSKTMRDLKEGVLVSVRGSMDNGTYNAKLIIIE